MLLALASVIAAKPDPPKFFQSGFGYFITSTGAGGLAVLLAAFITGGVGIWVARRVSKDAQDRMAIDRQTAEDRLKVDRQNAEDRLKVDRQNAEERLALDRQTAEQAAERADRRDHQERWWETLRWAYDRASDERTEARLTADVVLSLVEALGDQTREDTELAAAQALLRLLRNPEGAPDES